MERLVARGRVTESTSTLSRELEASYAAGVSIPREASMRVNTGMVRKEVVQRVQDQLEAQLPGRIHQLRIVAGEDSVVISGNCNSFYTKQLAQHLAMDVLEQVRLVNQLSVLPPK